MLVQAAPLVFADDRFALKGGTAINLFIRDMPRLSVDMDMAFTDYRLDREAAHTRINQHVQQSTSRLKQHGFNVHVPGSTAEGETRLFVRRDRVEVKVEVNVVARGTLYPVRNTQLTPAARATLLADLELPVLDADELYGSKLVAAMDRQHPRDLFDVMQLMEHEGITDHVRRSFVAYLACHNRPIHELLDPNLRDIAGDFQSGFRGMTTEPVELETLLEVRQRLIADLRSGLDKAERTFLISLARNEPEWSLLGFPHLEQLPAILWKVGNLAKLAQRNPSKFETQAQAVERLLS